MTLLNGFYTSIYPPKTSLFQTTGFQMGFQIAGRDGAVSLAMAELEPFLRVLLVTDGTITKSLEAYFGESVVVQLVEQSDTALPFDIPYLNMSRGDTVLARQIRLIGAQSGSVFGCAYSLINPAAIQIDMFDDLVQGRIGIGALIRARGLESYRELVDISHSPIDPLILNGSEGDAVHALNRTYGIVMQDKPAILVTEYFNRDQFTKD